tara:strand:- start:6312 stop:7235 length:924 start_codon:yes stop_codon:yes gene_type:complete
MDESLTPKKIRIATRKSPLALWQAQMVGQQIKKIDETIEIELIKITTSGDKILDKPLYDIGGKSLFLKELEIALLEGNCDIAVHSMKDMPATIHQDLKISAILEREDFRDVLISNKYKSLNDFEKGSSIGTSSIRRICNLKHSFKKIEIQNVRGNIDTRINKVKNNEIDGIIVAAAGVLRLGLKKHIAEFMDEREWLPAIGQGAIGIETKKNNFVINNLVEKLNDNETSICVNAEREVSRYFQANCNTPLAALAKISGNTIRLNAMIGSLDGQQKICFEADSLIENHKDLGIKVAKGLEAKGAKELL